jgi:hypothetical protein
VIGCTFPGRYGDLLWALPTLRALHDSGFGPVDLRIAGEFANLGPLLQRQPYLGRIYADPEWAMGHGARPPQRDDVISPYEQVLHLGYQRWPERVLPEEIYLQAVAQLGHVIEPLDLRTPWITRLTPPPYAAARDIVYGFSDCHFELKFGITELLFTSHEGRDVPWRTLGIFPPGSRWVTEGQQLPCDWSEAAAWIAKATVFLGDCSALHVLAVGLGIPVVLVEPMEARWNEIFYPLGKVGPQVRLVVGLDGQPTFDARHCAQALQETLDAR